MKTILLIIFSFVFLPIQVCSGTEDYIVGDGDVLTLNVYENEDLSTKVRVSADDTIRIPLIGEISVAGLNVSKISSKIEKLLADGYLVNPQVDVFINEYRSKKAIILGQIRNPGLYELRGKTTLLEFISKAGGLTSEAGNRATIKRKTPDKAKEQDNIPIDLEQLIEKGDTSLNLPIKDGDTLYISKADIYYVSGEVKKPDSYKFESGITIIKAITQAGGFSKIAAKNKVSIIRIVNGKKTIIENVKMDERVYPDDVIVVPESFF
ncbi:MAG: SLBB domain-containing protein [Desulfobacteraceae bacterium]